MAPIGCARGPLRRRRSGARRMSALSSDAARSAVPRATPPFATRSSARVSGIFAYHALVAARTWRRKPVNSMTKTALPTLSHGDAETSSR
ncbi:uncharacterized protein TRAVEDRAFT_54557 [Trametes versicolor FP-101664 SS1]|uniref:Uncharacterized protein n=1 Tax=Trametes versicolor (strain FP-101664) TaxID=717944 RepID=R7S760_TRAVS|nr:uncharacterized protein TRAVEDRAFT_54557 [Trametes versicolor FP-101664 SS1]EIW51440.1 hypothetical protein TRAVEDRAFT_54557 [Trametes versicolor FP-101664 SS1]